MSEPLYAYSRPRPALRHRRGAPFRLDSRELRRDLPGPGKGLTRAPPRRVLARRGARRAPRPRGRTGRRRLRPYRQYGVADALNVKAADVDLPPEKNRARPNEAEKKRKNASKRRDELQGSRERARPDMSVKPRFARVRASFLGFRARLWCTETPRPEPGGKNFSRLPSPRTEPARSANIQRERRVAQPRGCHFRTARVA